MACKTQFVRIINLIDTCIKYLKVTLSLVLFHKGVQCRSVLTILGYHYLMIKTSNVFIVIHLKLNRILKYIINIQLYGWYYDPSMFIFRTIVFILIPNHMDNSHIISLLIQPRIFNNFISQINTNMHMWCKGD